MLSGGAWRQHGQAASLPATAARLLSGAFAGAAGPSSSGSTSAMDAAARGLASASAVQHQRTTVSSQQAAAAHGSTPAGRISTADAAPARADALDRLYTRSVLRPDGRRLLWVQPPPWRGGGVQARGLATGCGDSWQGQADGGGGAAAWQHWQQPQPSVQSSAPQQHGAPDSHLRRPDTEPTPEGAGGAADPARLSGTQQAATAQPDWPRRQSAPLPPKSSEPTPATFYGALPEAWMHSGYAQMLGTNPTWGDYVGLSRVVETHRLVARRWGLQPPPSQRALTKQQWRRRGMASASRGLQHAPAQQLEEEGQPTVFRFTEAALPRRVWLERIAQQPQVPARLRAERRARALRAAALVRAGQAGQGVAPATATAQPSSPAPGRWHVSWRRRPRPFNWSMAAGPAQEPSASCAAQQQDGGQVLAPSGGGVVGAAEMIQALWGGADPWTSAPIVWPPGVTAVEISADVGRDTDVSEDGESDSCDEDDDALYSEVMSDEEGCEACGGDDAEGCAADPARTKRHAVRALRDSGRAHTYRTPQGVVYGFWQLVGRG